MALSFAAAMDQLGRVLRWYARIIDAANVDPVTLQAIEDDLVDNLTGEQAARTLTRFRASRVSLGGIVSPSNLLAAFTPQLLEVADAIGIPDRDPGSIMGELRKYMIANSQTVLSRSLTYGTPTQTAGSTTDKGNVYRLTVDRHGEDLQQTWDEAKKLRVTRDQGQATKHEEILQYTGTGRAVDFLTFKGSGARTNHGSLSSRGASGTGWGFALP